MAPLLCRPPGWPRLWREHWGETLFAEHEVAVGWLKSGGGRQHQLRPEPADGGGAELELAAIELRQLDHDRQAEARARLGLVQPAAAIADLLALLRRQPGTVIVDHQPHRRRGAVAARRDDLEIDPRLRPLAG